MKKFCPNAKPIDRMCPNGAKTLKGQNGQEWARMGNDAKSWACLGEVCPAGHGTEMSRTPHLRCLAAQVTNLGVEVS